MKHKTTTQKYIKTLIITSTILVMSLLIVIEKVTAQEVIRSFTIVPPVIEKDIDPGKNTEGRLKIINDSDEAITFHVTIVDFIVEDTQGTPVLLPDNTLSKKYSAASWLGITPQAFTIQPHKFQELNYYLQVPKDARPGGHYAAVVYKAENQLGVDGTGAGVNTQAGTLFEIGVNGPINEKSIVSKFFANGFQEYGPVSIKTQIKNLGDLHVTPKGTVVVTDSFGKKVGTQELHKNNIFPETARDYQNVFGKKFMIGRYKAVLNATYGKTAPLPLGAVIYFWVFPWKIALVIVFIFVALVLALMLWRKKRIHPIKPQTPLEQPAEKV